MSFREEVREWLRDRVKPMPPVNTPEGNAAHREWERQLAAERLSVVSWPVEFGGRDAPLEDWLVFEEEYWAADAPIRIGQNGLFLLAPTLFTYGTDEQKARILPKMADATEVWAQAWSEPDAGSDLAALRSTAARTDGGWVLNGQKTWSSRAVVADRAFGIFRSHPGERHRGLTYLMFDLSQCTVRPIQQLDGDAGFAEIFLDNVFVPDSDVIGEPGQGWSVAMSTASHERGLSLRSPGRFLATADRLVKLWRSHGSPAETRDRVADAWMKAQAYKLNIHAHPSVGKVLWSELDIAMHETALEIIGAGDPGRWRDGYLFSLAGPIYAGTNEIQRNLIAERILGLPR